MATTRSYRARPYTGVEDLQPVCDMINACDPVDKLGETFGREDMRTYIEVPDRDPERDVRIWEDREGRVSAYAMLWIPEDEDVAGGYLFFRVRPEARPDGLGDEVLAWATERMLEAGAERATAADLRCGGKDTGTYLLDLLKAHGFTTVRYSFDMVRDLGVAIPEPLFAEGFTLRHVQTGRDVEQWVEAFNDSFIDHWDFHQMTVEGRKHWIADRTYRPELDLVATAPDGTFAAFCSLVINTESNERNAIQEGLVDMLGTRRGYRNMGLGRAVLLAGMCKLKQEGMTTARLSVDAENPSGALRLYESAGFVKTSTYQANWKDLGRPAETADRT